MPSRPRTVDLLAYVFVATGPVMTSVMPLGTGPLGERLQPDVADEVRMGVRRQFTTFFTRRASTTRCRSGA